MGTPHSPRWVWGYMYSRSAPLVDLAAWMDVSTSPGAVVISLPKCVLRSSLCSSQVLD